MAGRETVFNGEESFRSNISRIVNSRYFLVVKWLIVICVVALFADVISNIDVAANLSKIPPATLISFIVMLFLSRVIYVGRWGMICQHIVSLPPLPYGYLLRVHLLGELGTILFFSAGAGEIVRVSKLAKKSEDIGLSTLAVALDRFFGVIGILLLALIFLPHLSFSPDKIWAVADGASTITVLLLTSICLLALWFGLKKGAVLLRQHRLNFSLPMMLKLLLLTVVGHLILATSYYLLIQKIHPLPYLALLALVFVSHLAKVVPLSVLGVSGSDVSLVALAYFAGVPSEEILVVIGVALFSLYLFALCGLLAELVVDGRTFIQTIFPRVTGDGGDGKG